MGAYNVAFVWALSVNGSEQQLDSYYPGSAYVDWIAADGFVRAAAPGPNVVNQLFGAWYNQFSSYGKPMMISDTGALPGDQAEYLGDLASALSPPTGATAASSVQSSRSSQSSQSSGFPLIKAVSYFDAPGLSSSTTGQSYVFDSAGLSAFQALSRLPYFQPSQQASTTAVNIAQDPSRTGTKVTLTANVDSDNGGAVTFLDNGSAIAGCEGVSLVSGPSCVTRSMPAGSTGSIEAVYTGDASYLASKSSPAPITVVAWTATPPGRASGSGSGATSGMAGPTIGSSRGALPRLRRHAHARCCWCHEASTREWPISTVDGCARPRIRSTPTRGSRRSSRLPLSLAVPMGRRRSWPDSVSSPAWAVTSPSRGVVTSDARVAWSRHRDRSRQLRPQVGRHRDALSSGPMPTMLRRRHKDL